MNNESIITSLYDIQAIQFGQFQLKSGQISPIYLNLRKIISYPDLLYTIAEALWQKVATYSFDLICGVPYTALPIATCLSLKYQLPMVMRRKEKKDYGTKQMVEGVWLAGQNCLIVEDVITTGSSVIETADELEKNKMTVSHVVALIDREQGGKENLQKKYQLHTVFTLSEMLLFLLKQNVMSPIEAKLVEEFLQRLGRK